MIKLSHGNKKLVSNEKVQFLIFNLPAVITCPFSTAECRKSCYALKAERLYPQARKRRLEHLEATRAETFVTDMITAIDAEYQKAKKKGKRIYFRWHESGDVYSLDYMFKIIQIARAFDNTDIVFQLYTKSVEFIPSLGIPKNLHITYSIWSDTKPEAIARAHDLGLQTFSAVPHFTNEPKKNRCVCADCATCRKCYNNSIKNVICEVH